MLFEGIQCKQSALWRHTEGPAPRRLTGGTPLMQHFPLHSVTAVQMGSKSKALDPLANYLRGYRTLIKNPFLKKVLSCFQPNAESGKGIQIAILKALKVSQKLENSPPGIRCLTLQ